jgi:mono/diheme cytochrome c family protein
MHGVRKKWKGIILIVCFFLLAGVFISLTLSTKHAYGTDEATVNAGKEVYNKYCIICHGDKGDGKGLVGVIQRVEKSGLVWTTYPRDFTVGVFKFRSTATGCLPTDEDLMRTIEFGILRSGMPSHKDVAMEQRKAVREYIKTFAKRWEEEDPCDPILARMPEWVGTAAAVEKGQAVYKEMKCWECHGYQGKGDGPKSDQLKDDWGDKILPFDFTTGTLKRGSSPENVYITYTTGLDGTGMPSYEDSVKEEDRWNLCSYTLKLMGLLE